MHLIRSTATPRAQPQNAPRTAVPVNLRCVYVPMRMEAEERIGYSVAVRFVVDGEPEWPQRPCHMKCCTTDRRKTLLGFRSGEEDQNGFTSPTSAVSWMT